MEYVSGSVAARDCDGVMSLSDPLLPGSDPLSTALAPPYRLPVLAGILKAVGGVLDWLPLIAVSSLNGSYSPAVALGAGTGAGAFVLLLQCLKQQCYDPRTIFPKVMDLGQFGLFGLLWVFSEDGTNFLVSI